VQPSANTPPLGALDSALNSGDGTPTVTVSGSLTVTGWAADNESGSPVARVSIDIDGTRLGNANLGSSRPTWRMLWKTRLPQSGYQFTRSIGDRPSGRTLVHATAYDSEGLST
jgi:hypothetical protein